MPIDITLKMYSPVGEYLYRGTVGGLSRDIVAGVSGPIQFRGKVFGASVGI